MGILEMEIILYIIYERGISFPLGVRNMQLRSGYSSIATEFNIEYYVLFQCQDKNISLMRIDSFFLYLLPPVRSYHPLKGGENNNVILPDYPRNLTTYGRVR